MACARSCACRAAGPDAGARAPAAIAARVPRAQPLAAGLAGRDVLLDGELVCLDANGHPDFQRLRRRLSATGADSAANLSAATPPP
jgi:bifunctional non-homologous end joining protein LigD